MMLRLMIQWTERQKAAVTAEAERLGVSASDVIRRILDAWIDRSMVDSTRKGAR